MFKANMVNSAQSPMKIPREEMNNSMNSIASKENPVTPDSSASYIASRGNDSQTAQQLTLNLNGGKGSDFTK